MHYIRGIEAIHHLGTIMQTINIHSSTPSHILAVAIVHPETRDVIAPSGAYITERLYVSLVAEGVDTVTVYA